MQALKLGLVMAALLMCNELFCCAQLAEAALADEWVKTGDRMALQRRVLRLGKPPRRWRRPPWAATALWEPPQVTIVAKPLANVIGAF